MIKIYDQRDDIKPDNSRIVVLIECSLLTYKNQLKSFFEKTHHTVIESSKLKQRIERIVLKLKENF